MLGALGNVPSTAPLALNVERSAPFRNSAASVRLFPCATYVRQAAHQRTGLLLRAVLDLLIDRLGDLLQQPGTLAKFVPSLTAMIAFWATLSLNMPDFTRFGRSQREQAIGQTVALPTTMTMP